MQGQSEYTFFKELRFAPIFTQSLRISKAAAIAQYAYYHVDLNAGSGFNEEAHVDGSPLNFLDAVERNERLNFYAFLVDRDPTCIKALIDRPIIQKYADRVFTYPYDNREILPIVDAFIANRERNPHLAVGSILIDPNGYHGGIPWEELRIFCAAHPRFDVLMNLNVRSFRMERVWIERGRTDGWRAKTLHPISDFPQWFKRNNWMLTDICRIKNDWVQLVGRSLQTTSPDYRSLGFYDLRSPRGIDIVARIERTTPRSMELPLLSQL